MKKAPPVLTLLQLARMLCGRTADDATPSPCVERMHRFLVRAATPFNPAHLARKDHLIVYFADRAVTRAEMRALKEAETIGRRSSLYVGRDYFLNLIRHTGRRYPKLKEAYHRHRFWD